MLNQTGSARAFTDGEFAAALEAIVRFENRPFLAVAVSGGPDSMALAILAHRWAIERGAEIRGLTVDHRLRPESAGEARRVGGWLAARGMRHEILVWNGKKPLSGIQERARAARYRLLAQWCRDAGCVHLLTAHHREDQAETHLIRRRAHSGPDGLAGMSAIRELAGCRLIRPLLAIPKARLVAFLDAQEQPYVSDPSNRDPAFERSRLRACGLPDLAALGREIRAFGTERVARAHRRERLLADAASLHPAGFAALESAPLLAAPRAAAEHALAALAATIGDGRERPIRHRRVARLCEELRAAAPSPRTLGGCRFVPWRGRILVLREIGRAAAPVALRPGASVIWDGRFRVSLCAAAPAGLVAGYLGENRPSAPGRRLPPGILPPLLRAILPAVWDKEGLLAVPHLGYQRGQGALLPRFVFEPAYPLTRADFTVV